jgi:hypothetical protein
MRFKGLRLPDEQAQQTWYKYPQTPYSQPIRARLSLQSSELAPPAHSPASECFPLAVGGGGGGANSDEGTNTLVWYSSIV